MISMKDLGAAVTPLSVCSPLQHPSITLRPLRAILAAAIFVSMSVSGNPFSISIFVVQLFVVNVAVVFGLVFSLVFGLVFGLVFWSVFGLVLVFEIVFAIKIPSLLIVFLTDLCNHCRVPVGILKVLFLIDFLIIKSFHLATAYDMPKID
jgi:hypothetical protein